MQVDELISIGCLGKSLDKNGFIGFKRYLELPQEFNSLKEIFLIFKDHRVRFVDVEFSPDNKDKIKIIESDMVSEIINSADVKLALSQDDIDELRTKSGLILPGIMEIFYQHKKIGTLIEIFNNNAHDILVVELNDGKEIMIPYVDRFVINSDNSKIFVTNIEDLLKL
ncbi:MAG: hypothetical protein APR54_01130 [Candidatus Cloacimonas sp. SDB]|nr:MAG: hypothetical protein APR54_01130 [Candidatus Cloacimonas sp. SDB]